jgi:hypothetical protein
VKQILPRWPFTRGTHRVLTYEGEDKRDNTGPGASIAKALMPRLTRYRLYGA